VELIRKNIHMEHCLKLASTQISLEEDQNISDQKPDAFQIVCKKSNINITETKIQDETILVKGQLLYEVLYLTEEKEKRLCSIEGVIPFEEKIYVNQAISGEGVRIKAAVEDLMIRLINSRKINIRCIISMNIMQDKLYDEEMVVDADGQKTCEILKKPLDMTTIVLDTKDIYRIKEEINIPDGLPNIYNLLWKSVRVDGLHFIPMDGKIGVQGEWTSFFLYEGEEEENTAKYFEIVRPFSGILEIPDCRENMTLYVEYEVDTPQIEVRSDYDGENRLVGLEMELKLFIKLYQNTILSVVTDAYGIDEPLEPIMKESIYERMIKKENGKLKLGDTIENKENPEGNLQIIHTYGFILDEKLEMGEDEVNLLGVVHAELLCAVDDEDVPYRNIAVDIPYHHAVTVMGADKECPCYGKVCIEQLSSAVMGGRIEVRAILDYQLNVSKKVHESILSGMGKVTNSDEENAVPVMAVYFAGENETIWDAGKKYRVSLNSIRDVNQLNSDEISAGQKLLITKEIAR